jgi:hypothetical protein
MLESVIQDSPASFNLEPFVFNLTSLYELCPDGASQRKQMLMQLLAQNVGDGFDAAGCLKV